MDVTNEFWSGESVKEKEGKMGSATAGRKELVRMRKEEGERNRGGVGRSKDRKPVQPVIKPVQPVLLQCEQLKRVENNVDCAEFLPN